MFHNDPVITLLRDLVAIDSVNPTLVPGARGETDIARRLADELRAYGLAVEISEAAQGDRTSLACSRAASTVDR